MNAARVQSITVLHGLTRSPPVPAPGVSGALVSQAGREGRFVGWGVVVLPVGAGGPGRVAA